METLKHSACTVGLGSATLSQLVFPGKSNPNFPWEKSQVDDTAVIVIIVTIIRWLFIAWYSPD